MKAARNGYSEEPFFYTEPFEAGNRIVVWNQDEKAQEKLFFKLVELYDERIEYLFKEDVSEGGKAVSDHWKRIFGGIMKENLKQILKKHKKWFFSSSGFQLCLREPDMSSYFAYDEHGLFYVYDMPQVQSTLSQLKYSEEKRQLINEVAHWHVCDKDSEKHLKDFKAELVQRSVFADEVNPPSQES